MPLTLESKIESPISISDPLPNGKFKRWMNASHPGMPPYLVKVLDERIVYASSDGNTIQVRQFIDGYHDSSLARNWRRHLGWQMEESIREELRVRILIGGVEEIKIREIDVSERKYRFS